MKKVVAVNQNGWISPKKIKPFDSNLTLIMYNLGNGKIILKCDNSVLMQRNSTSLYSNVKLKLYTVYELNNWRHNLCHDITVKH